MFADRRQYLLGLALVFSAVVAWSTAGLFTRVLVADTTEILFWRGVFGAAGMLLVLLVVPQFGGLSSFSKLGKPGVAYAAVTALSMLCFITALAHTSVAHTAVITAAVPFIAGYLGWVLLKEKPTRIAIAASVLALLGVAIMVGVGSEGGLFGDALAIAMAITMAGMILISRKYPAIPALAASCLASTLTALAVLPFVNLTGVTGHELVILALFGIVNQVLGFGLFAIGARWLAPTETALLVALDAPLAPFWVWLVFSETPGLATIFGGSLVLIAVVGYVAWTKKS